MNDKTKEVEKLIDKAVASPDSGDALRFSQAACNVANAISALALSSMRSAKENS